MLWSSERWEATLQGVAEAHSYIQSMEKASSASKEHAHSQAAAQMLKSQFRKASARTIAMGKARVMMEQAVEKAERILLDKKRLENAKVASREEQAEVIAQELYHKPGSLLSEKELAHIYQESRCEELRVEPDCFLIPFHHSIRTISGVCNNEEDPTRGASFTPFRRILPPLYTDGIYTFPNQIIEDVNAPGIGPFSPPSPSARLVSDTTVVDRVVNDSEHTHLIMQFGQFMDHDLNLAVEFEEQDCDLDTCEPGNICAPIKVPNDDEDFGEGTAHNGRCHAFQRTVPACEETNYGFSPRQQVNELTQYIDASNVYGSTVARANFLREFNGGRMNMSEGNNLPRQPPCAPVEESNGHVVYGMTDCCPDDFEENQACYVGGDVRAIEMVQLTVIHTIFLREHNRVAKALSGVNPHWQDERLYTEARNIVIAEMQHITFNEYLPALFGQTFDYLIGCYYGYNAEADSSIPNGFATAAYRFGHSQIQPIIERLDENFETIAAGPLNLRDSFFSATAFDDGGGVDPIVRGWLRQPARAVDEFVNSVLTTQLFEQADAPGEGMDLVTLNIQRGRDHGLPRYGTWKRYCKNFFGIESDFRNELTEVRLMQLYGSLENVDLFVGALAEEALPDGGILGAVSSCIFAITFRALRDGDRFWYENEDETVGLFTGEQRAELEKVSLSRVLCDNSAVTEIQPRALFLDPDMTNTKECNVLPEINFSAWSEEPYCFYRAVVSTNEPTTFTFLNRELVTGTITDFQMTVSSGTFSRCIPFKCPKMNISTDIFTSVGRGRVCNVVETGLARYQNHDIYQLLSEDLTNSESVYRRVVTQDNIENHPLLYKTELECEYGGKEIVTTLVAIICDDDDDPYSQSEAGPNRRRKMASRVELEKELANALDYGDETKVDYTTFLTPTKLEKTATNEESFEEGLFDFDDSAAFGVSISCIV